MMAIALAVSISAAPVNTAQGRQIFQFHTDEFWLNLHHFLYVLGRAERRTADAEREAVRNAPADAQQGMPNLTDAERQIWNDAVRFYAAGPSRKDLVFDEPLPAVTAALAEARGVATLSDGGLDVELARTLQKAAPIYRKTWWPAHQAANEKWRNAIQALVDRYGATILRFITRTFGLEWPDAGFPVHVSGYANWAGAYSTTGDLLVLSSLDPLTQGTNGLETVFHEGMHVWDDRLAAMLRNQTRTSDKRLPRNLSHALIFFTAGEAVHRAVPEHVPYADANGVWERGMLSLREALVETWKPYLDGRGSRDEALAALIAKTSEPRR